MADKNLPLGLCNLMLPRFLFAREKDCALSHLHVHEHALSVDLNTMFFLQHRDTPENNADTPFELNQKNLEVSKPSS